MVIPFKWIVWRQLNLIKILSCFENEGWSHNKSDESWKQSWLSFIKLIYGCNIVRWQDCMKIEITYENLVSDGLPIFWVVAEQKLF